MSSGVSNLGHADFRALVRLAARLPAAAENCLKAKRQALDALSHLLEAYRWAWVLADWDKGVGVEYRDPHWGGFSKWSLDQKAERDVSKPPAKDKPSFFSEVSARVPMATRIQVVEDAASLVAACPLFVAAKGVPFILSLRRLRANRLSMLGFYREERIDPFSRRECEMAEVLLAALPWLHRPEWPEDERGLASRLSARKRMVLNLLREGWSRKQIAAELGISMHTLGGYIKEVYRHLGVGSQAELMGCRELDRAWGKRP